MRIYYPGERAACFCNLSDANGKQIREVISIKGFERRKQALTTSSSPKNNTRFPCTMQVCGASVDLK